MIFALSLSPCIDKTVRLPRFDPDAPNRVQTEREDIAGKGVNVARATLNLGGESMVVGLDYQDGPVAAAMAQEGVPCLLIPAPGRLRTNLKIRETDTGRTLEINEQGEEAPTEVIRQVINALLPLIRPGDWVSLSGRLPPGAPADTYRRFCALVQEKGGYAAVDCDGPALAEALKARPALIKPNAQEFSVLTGADPADEKSVLSACGALLEKGIGRICLSRGKDGALLFSPRGAWRCPAAQVPVRGTQGAGDTMLAALMLAFSRKTPEPQALRFASAAAGASVQRPGTLLCTEEDALSLLSSLPDAETLK